MDQTTAIILGVLVIAFVAVVAWVSLRKRHSKELREHFGSEYQEAVRKHGDPARAEADLESRRKRLAKVDIHPIPAAEQERFARQWRAAQSRFVDAPTDAVREAEQLVVQLMQAMGYPVGDFEQRAADISVDHPGVVEHYRVARRIAKANERGEAGTDDLREAMIRYRQLFEDLLQTGATQQVQEEVMAHP
jgi:FtsZ-interacting cell division protein ZipA